MPFTRDIYYTDILQKEALRLLYRWGSAHIKPYTFPVRLARTVANKSTVLRRKLRIGCFALSRYFFVAEFLLAVRCTQVFAVGPAQRNVA